MNDLRELIGQTVTATIRENDIRCKVIDLQIEDYYFQEKGEDINITVNAVPIGEMPKGFFYEDLIGIPLCDITK